MNFEPDEMNAPVEGRDFEWVVNKGTNVKTRRFFSNAEKKARAEPDKKAAPKRKAAAPKESLRPKSRPNNEPGMNGGSNTGVNRVTGGYGNEPGMNGSRAKVRNGLSTDDLIRKVEAALANAERGNTEWRGEGDTKNFYQPAVPSYKDTDNVLSFNTPSVVEPTVPKRVTRIPNPEDDIINSTDLPSVSYRPKSHYTSVDTIDPDISQAIANTRGLDEKTFWGILDFINGSPFSPKKPTTSSGLAETLIP